MLAAHIVGSSVVYSTIQSAVTAASAGATITVDPGTYSETVTVNKKLTIHGAEFGVDARSNQRQANSSESIVSNAAGGESFYITASDVTIDGFTVQGETNQSTATGAGIVIAPNINGTHILNNIVQNNVAGLFLASNSTTDPAVIQHNLFQNNNNAGSDGGRGIYTDSGVSGGNLTGVQIDSNAFVNNHGGSGTTGYEAAISLESTKSGAQSGVSITNNVFDSDGKALLAFNASTLTIIGNTIINSGDYQSGALRFEGNVSGATITGNTVYKNTGPAIRIDEKATSGTNSGIVATSNNFFGNSTASGTNDSIEVAANTYSGSLNLTKNWWGSTTGPSGDGAGSGDQIHANGANDTFTGWATTPFAITTYNYLGAIASTGVPIQAEDFAQGGQGIGYENLTNLNQGGQYRTDVGVGIEQTSDVGGGYDVGWTQAGDWLNYTVNVAAAGSYRFDFRIATGQTNGGTFSAMIDGQNVTGEITAPSTGSNQTWVTVSSSAFALTAGTHTIRFNWDTNGNWVAGCNLNWLQLTPIASAVPSAPTSLAATAASTSQINLSWNYSGTTPTGFQIDRSTDDVNFTTIATVGASPTSYADTSLLAGTPYYYRVRAFNSVGTSTNSNIASATTLSMSTTVSYLSDLQWVSATAGYGSVQKDKSINGNAITVGGVQYAKGLGAHAVSNIVYNLAGLYNTFVSDVGIDSEENGVGTGSVDFQVIGDGKVLFNSGVLTNSSATVHVNVSVAGVQQLTLVATNGVANSIDYDHADWAGAELLGAPVAPTAPLAVTATALSTTSIKLAWAMGSSNLTSYAIDRSTDGTNFTTIATGVSSSLTTWTDPAVLSANTKYYYRIRAVNSVGSSPNSAVASATTLPQTTVTNLSSLNWTSATTGYGSVMKNETMGGNTITLRGKTYATGIGTHAVSNIAYNLAGKYSTFVSDVGVDDEENGKGIGSVDFQVFGDGKLLFDSGVLTNNSPIVSLNVSVAGVQTLTLVATNGVSGSIDYDHSDWAGAMLYS